MRLFRHAGHGMTPLGLPWRSRRWTGINDALYDNPPFERSLQYTFRIVDIPAAEAMQADAARLTMQSASLARQAVRWYRPVPGDDGRGGVS